ncbi:MAG: class I SAM-dependent methyltransferase [Allosphingosinicella sp.]|uniref:class I SAM-dependent methyltransferase n=1 Tax=Allosphingosinicella sp. TaxID=2823234 RepID=UPI00392159E2
MGAASFAERSGDYAAARPTYPPELFDWIAGQCASREAAWDCATGNGQAALGLAARFATVHATDLSLEQVAHGFAAPNIVYAAAPAERSGFPPASFDLVTVAQALHWFDFPRFWTELSRVARPGAFFCAWGYSWFDPEPELDAALLAPLRRLLDPFWAPANRILWNGYPSADIAFPFDRLSTPSFRIELEWRLADLLAYVRTWSAAKAAERDPDAAARLAALSEAAERSIDGTRRFPLAMPLSLVAARIG